ncbi:hypothetical protein N8569_00710, partial [bacterium]|nr:hypothetical protein [bacterium]
VQGFRQLWQSLHTKPGTRWEDSPEVVALTFTVHKQNIDTTLAQSCAAYQDAMAKVREAKAELRKAEEKR